MERTCDIKKIKKISKAELAKWIYVFPDMLTPHEQTARSEADWILQKIGIIPIFASECAKSGERGEFCVHICEGKECLGKKLTQEAYCIEFKSNEIRVTGNGRGVFFGLYELMRVMVGYVYYAADEVVVCDRETYDYYDGVIYTVPDIDGRSLGFHDVFKIEKPGVLDYANRIGLGRNSYSDWVTCNHTYFEILPKQKYYADHSDWYSPDGNNLCLSNAGMQNEFVESLKRIIANPGRKGNYVMLGQEDNFTFCDCPKCRAAIKEYGSESAVMLKFTNDVVKRMNEWLAKTYPEREITFVTFAYNKTATPPVKKIEETHVEYKNGVAGEVKTTKYEPLHHCVTGLEDNLAVMVVPFSGVYSHSFLDEKYNPQVKDNFLGWSAICKNLFIWSYCVNFDAYMLNLQNFTAIAQNYKLLKDLNFKFIFDQGPHNKRTPAFDELRIYTQSKLLWNTDSDYGALVDEFMNGYYKDIAPFMKTYYNAIIDRWNIIEAFYGEYSRSGGGDSSFWLNPTFFPKWWLDGLMEIFREARCYLETIRVDEWDKYLTLRDRLRKQMLSVEFMLIAIYPSSFGLELNDKIAEFKATCKKFGITGTNEGEGAGIVFSSLLR